MQSALKVLFPGHLGNHQLILIDLLYCDSPALSSLINDKCDDDDGLSTTIHRNGEKDVHESGMGVEPMCQVTQSFSKQF